MNLAVIGLGKLGLCTAACFASHGFEVWAYDSNPRIMEALAQGKNPIQEPLLNETLEKARDNIKLAENAGQAVKQAQITMIIVPTPSLEKGDFDNSLVERVLEDISPALKEKDEFHVVDVISTVSPGSCQKRFIPLLEKKTQKVLGEDFGLVYNPEFIALGQVIQNFLNPDMVLIGASDEKSSHLVRLVYEATCPDTTKIHEMSLINAEICKLSLNCYVTMKISFANELAGICESIPQADWEPISRALGADTRIGSRCLKAGMGFGGPCFPRDNLAFTAFAQKAGQEARLSPNVVAVNKNVVKRIHKKIQDHAPLGSKIAILGLSYKPGTHIVEESQAVELAEILLDQGYEVSLHDPLSLAEVRKKLKQRPHYAVNVEEAVSQAKVVAILTDWPQYKTLPWETLSKEAQPKAMLLDAWGIYKDKQPRNFKYLALGKGPE